MFHSYRAIIVSAFLSLVLLCNCEANDLKPNIIVIFTDDHGYSDLQCQGMQNDLRTPNIDAIAGGGVRMTSGYVTAPQCVPSRAGLLTGKSQNRFGVESNGLPLDGFNAQQTIAERLKKAGYATGMTGKWHLGPQDQIVDHGFDDVYHKNANRPGWANFDLDGTDREAGPEYSRLYHLDANSEAACTFIDRHYDEPFFFYCAYRAPHVPLDAPPKYLNRFPGEMPERRRQALAMISAMDDGVGRIVDTLRKHDIEERTLIFMIGDNGAPLKIHKRDVPGGGPGWDGSLNEPFNGEKGMLSEGGIRVPFLIYWKGMIEGGRTYDHPVVSLDVAATAVAVAGLPDDPQLDGVNIVPYLKGQLEGAPHQSLYWRWIAQAAAREGKWKYLRGGAREYLFDLDADKEEKLNLIDKHPDVARRLQDNLKKWADDMNPPGLETKNMSSTWEGYYDFYLDGKPAPEPQVSKATASVKGWICRNGRIKLKDGFLQVQANKKKDGVFIAANGLDLPGNVTAVIHLKTEEPGTVVYQWREKGQKDFLPDSRVAFEVQASAIAKEYRVPLRGNENIIHVRVVFQNSGSDIRRIDFKNGSFAQSWDFTD